MLSHCVLEKTLESPLDSKYIRPVNPKGNQLWIFIGRIDAEMKTPILWLPDVKNRLIGKDPDAGKGWRREEKGTTEEEMVNDIPDSMDMSLSKLRETAEDRKVSVLWSMGHKELEMSDWTTNNKECNKTSLLFAYSLVRDNFREQEKKIHKYTHFHAIRSLALKADSLLFEPPRNVGCHFLLQGIFLTQGWKILPVSFVFPALVGRFFTSSATWEDKLIQCSIIFPQSLAKQIFSIFSFLLPAFKM